MKHTFTTVLWLLFLLPWCSSQEVRFSKLTNDIFDGGMNCVNVLEDTDGQIWFNTSNGVVRYDGVNSTVFQSDPTDSASINHNITRQTIQIGDDVYVITWGNGGILNKINLADHRVVRIKPHGDVNTAHRNLLKLDNGYGLAGGDVCLLYFNLEKQTSICLPYPLALPLFQETKDRFAVAVQNELLHFQVQQDTPYLSDRFKVSGKIISTEIISGCRILGTSKGLISLDGSLHIPTPLQNIDISALKRDSYDRLWIGTSTDGLYLWNLLTNQISHFLADASPGHLHSNNISCLYEDSNHILWIGTPAGPFYTDLKPNFISRIPASEHDISLTNFNSLFEDQQGKLWICTRTGIYRYDFNSKTYLKDVIPITGATHAIRYRTANETDETYLVASNTSGAYLLQRNPLTQSLEIIKHFSHLPDKPNGLSSTEIMSVFQDDDGRIWFGTYLHGIDILHPDGQWQHLKREQLQGVAISRILMTDDSTIWISKYDNGLIKCKIQKDGSFDMIHFTPGNSSLSYHTISSLATDGFQNLWIGTIGGGLYQLKHQADAFLRYSTQEGLISNNIYAVVCDAKNNVWCSTASGLALLEHESEKFKIFKDVDGLPQNAFAFYSYCHLSNGSIAFGTPTGIAVINPDSLKSTSGRFNPIVSRIKIYNKTLLPGEESPIQQNPYRTKELILPYDQDLLTFEFSNGYYKNPQRVEYAYYLQGFDRQWIDLGKSNVATFTRLPPGNYTLHVRSSIDEGSSYSHIKHPLKITILPPWWKTWWFKILMVLTASALIYYIFRQRTQRLLAIQRIEIEKTLALEAERTRISRDMHDDLGSGLSAIHLMSNYLTENAEEKYPEFSVEINKIRKSSEDLNQSIREIIWTVNTKDDSLNSLILFIRRYCHELNEKVKTRIHVDAPDPVPEIQLSGVQRKHVFLCVKEALNNALKHGKPSEIHLHITCDPKNQISITIQDNGVGMNSTELLRMNKGNGLMNMKERMSDIDGTVEIVSEGEGTEVRLSFKT